MERGKQSRIKPTIENCNYIQHKHLNNLLSRQAHGHTPKESDQMVFNWTSSPEDSRAEDQGLSGTFPPRVVFKVTRSVEEEEENDGQYDHQGHDDEQERSKTRSTVLSQTSQMYLSGHNDHTTGALSPFYPLRAWLDPSPLCALPSASVGGGSTFPLVSARRTPGAEGFRC